MAKDVKFGIDARKQMMDGVNVIDSNNQNALTSHRLHLQPLSDSKSDVLE